MSHRYPVVHLFIFIGTIVFSSLITRMKIVNCYPHTLMKIDVTQPPFFVCAPRSHADCSSAQVCYFLELENRSRE